MHHDPTSPEAVAADVVRDAEAVQTDLRVSETHLKAAAESLSKLGGKAKRNCSRDLRKHIDNHLQSFLEPYVLKGVPLQDSLGEEFGADVPMLLPHELVSCLHGLGWPVFSGVLLGGIPECLCGIDIRTAPDFSVQGSQRYSNQHIPLSVEAPKSESP